MNTYNMDKMYESFAGSMELMQRWLDESEQENKQLKQENKQLKDKIDKVIEKLEEVKERRIMLLDEEKVLEILKEVE